MGSVIPLVTAGWVWDLNLMHSSALSVLTHCVRPVAKGGGGGGGD